ncbi:hypothetical protein [Marilutibacter alkalisoli]|uniref:DUF4124 domain-containing protein n=1 Tax=Marilutibacter alkalisoli TaxID=2591633 RepID=A0A514BRV9_9GAMM|nr:hypothetical protein [Lysobacter alkalisoli]QDH70123.1 hypothetical protein FKV23_08455 [Lysobacter alkalisoli]
MHFPRLSCTTLLAAGLLLLSANADASYKAWYVDDNNGYFEYGDLAEGNTKLTIPNSACGRRWTLPSYYRWVDQYGNTISSADLYSTVEIWVPKAGCPNGNELVFQTQAGHVYEPALGTHYLQLYSNYGSSWIGADGKHLSCLPGCVPLGGWGYKVNNHSWGNVELLLEDIKQALPDGDTRRADALLAEARKRLPELTRQIDTRIQERRRTQLDGFERYISSVEDAASRNLQVSAKRLLDCQGNLATRSLEKAYAGCSQALDTLRHAGALLDLAEGEWSDL